MHRLLLPLLLSLSGCALRYVAGNERIVDGASGQTSGSIGGGPGTSPGTPVVITIDGSSGSLCDPDDPDPQHTCPAKAGPDQR